MIACEGGFSSGSLFSPLCLLRFSTSSSPSPARAFVLSLRSVSCHESACHRMRPGAEFICLLSIYEKTAVWNRNKKRKGPAQEFAHGPSDREHRGEALYHPQLPPISALSALEDRIHTTGDNGARLVTLHLAGEGTALGAEIVVAFDEVAPEVANLENLHRQKRDPELSRAGHPHLNATTRKERCFSLANLEGADRPSIESLTAQLDVQRLVPDPVQHSRSGLQKDL